MRTMYLWLYLYRIAIVVFCLVPPLASLLTVHNPSPIFITSVIDNLRTLEVPPDLDTIFTAELTNGVISRVPSNKVKDSLPSKKTQNTTGDWQSSLLPTVCVTLLLQLLGLPRPLVCGLVGLYATTKVPQAGLRKVRGFEVAGDMVKWMVFDAALGTIDFASLDWVQQIEVSVVFGCAATLLGLVAKDVFNPKSKKRFLNMAFADYGKVSCRRCSLAVAEAILIFSTVASCSTMIHMVIPASLNYDPLFDQLIQDIEDYIQPLDGIL